ncbi:MAG: hypothetical protein GX066_08110 [Clostridiaceae bacterium]|nr:hypothetical protein [Clostridiaceae bacterium]
MNTYSIGLRNHFWIDSGIAGLYLIAESNPERLKRYGIGIKINEENNALEFTYCELSNLRQFLFECYNDDLAMLYWNVSTSKQKQNPELVLMDEQTKELKLGPKRIPTPIASLFVKGSSWKAKGVTLNELNEDEKSRVKAFLEKNKKELWGKKKYLLYELPTCHPKLEILPETKSKRKSQVCCVCGRESNNYSEVGQPSYLLFASNTAAKSFNSQAKMPDVICWECEFLSKFAIHTAGYKKVEDDLLIIQAYSPSIQMLIDIQSEMGANSPMMKRNDDDIFYCNIGLESDSLVQYASKPFELLWAFFNDKFSLLLKEQIKKRAEENLLYWLDENEFNNFFQKIYSNPVMFFLIYAETGSKTFITKDLTIYQDICYVFRLLRYMLDDDINLKVFYNSLWDSENKKNPNLVREKVCRSILLKHSILYILEPFYFRKIMNGQIVAFSNIFSFIKNYELLIKKEGVGMNKEQVDVAVNLGRQIAGAVIPKSDSGEGIDKSKTEAAIRKIKGDLFVLRKARTTTDFLNQLNNMMFRYGITVSGKLLDGILEDVKFEEFRAYCIMGALQVINAVNNSLKEVKS